MLFEEELDRLLKPGYMPMETGYHYLPNGQMYIAILTPMPGCRGEWIDWWFGTGLRDSAAYKNWNPKSHIRYEWDQNWKPGRYIGAGHYGEIAMGDKIFKFKLIYNDPGRFIDTSKFDDLNIKTVFCGEGFTPEGTPNFRVIRVVRDTEYGCEIRTRFWNDDCTEDMAQARLDYNIASMAMLADSLKTLKGIPGKLESGSEIYCKFCQSTAVVRNGWRKNSQYYLCKSCGRGFIDNQALPKMKFPVCTIASAVRSYYDGCSLNRICRDIEQKTNISPSRSTIYRWVTRLTEEALEEENKNHPSVGSQWILYQSDGRFKDRKYWLVTVVDFQTHFLLASRLFFDLDKSGLKSLLESAMEKAGKKPGEVLTNIKEENREGIYLVCGPNSQHFQVNTLTNPDFYPSFVKTWHKMVQNRLKPGCSPDGDRGSQIITKGFALHYNYIHPGDGSSPLPALASGVKSPFKDWNNELRPDRTANYI